jgi:CubicO group peptidase (beta-lactamase class C family)
MKKLFPISFIISVSVSYAQAQDYPDYSQLDTVVNRELKETNTPGAAIAIIKNNKIIVSKAYGISNIETGAPVTTDMLFYHGGLSRLFIATTLLLLADEGKLNINIPIGNYIKGLTPKIARVTTHQLLSSTAGLKEEHQTRCLCDTATLNNIIHSWKADRVFTEPGQIYSGSHLSYALAGLVIEKVTGKYFPDVVREKVFKPLGMYKTTYRPLEAITYPFSQGHTSSSNELPKIYRPFAQNSVGWPRNSFISVNDASRFLIALVNDGMLEGRQVLSSSIITALLKAYAINPASSGEEIGYGVDISNNPGYRLLRINTGWGGMEVSIRIIPEQHVGIIIIANGDNTLRKATEKALQMFVNVQTAPPAVSTIQKLQLLPDEAKNYVGIYANERIMSLFVKDDKLFLQDNTRSNGLGSYTNGENWQVSKVGDHYFIAENADRSQSIRFALIKEKGKIVYMHFGGRALKKRE